MTIYNELNDLKSSGVEVSEEVLNNYADRLSAGATASATQPDLDELIDLADSRANWSVRINVGDEALNAQMDQIREAMTIYNELNDLKSSDVEVSDEVLNNYADRLMDLK